jgi:hypothetical protein
MATADGEVKITFFDLFLKFEDCNFYSFVPLEKDWYCSWHNSLFLFDWIKDSQALA